MQIPKVISTQHPDNVRIPFFATNSILEGEDEIKEAFYAYSHLRCQEQLWDCEGKEVDNYVVKKLFTKYEPFFSKNVLGKDFFLTLRIPNPDVEKNEAKILIETLESIPRSFDVAKEFYNNNSVPIFEVTLPMVTSADSLIRIVEFYRKLVVGKEGERLFDGDITVGEWIGAFNPKDIRVIPLIETKESILNADKIVEEYVARQKVEGYQRVWLARSDPALNYGSLTAILLAKIALKRLHELQERVSLDILPMLGCGSAPFRGNLKPTNLNCLDGYPSVHTFTIQSAFKYDYEEDMVRRAIEKINDAKRGQPMFFDEIKALEIIDKVSMAYQEQIKLLAPLINAFSTYIPQRRKRKLHIGLFGYARTGGGVTLPRAIPFCATLYSLGLPPELLGLHVLDGKNLDFIKDTYKNFEADMKDALQFVNRDNFDFFPDAVIREVEKVLQMFGFEANEKHKKISSIILNEYKSKNFASLEENIVRAGSVRGFLG